MDAHDDQRIGQSTKTILNNPPNPYPSYLNEQKNYPFDWHENLQLHQ